MALPVNKVRGIGPKTVAYLATRKIKTVEQLLSSKLEILANAPGIGPARAEAAFNAAAEILAANSLENTDTPVSSEKANKPKKKDKNKDKPKGKKNKEKNKKDGKGKKEKKKNKKDKKKNK